LRFKNEQDYKNKPIKNCEYKKLESLKMIELVDPRFCCWRVRKLKIL